jgi:hypothetical protein
MSALSDALASSQAKAVAALGKAYIRRDEEPDDEFFAGMLRRIGCDDDVQIAFLLCAWHVLREEKAPAPGESRPAIVDAMQEPATDRQWERIRRDCERLGVEVPAGPLTKQEASMEIERLKATDPVPF